MGNKPTGAIDPNGMATWPTDGNTILANANNKFSGYFGYSRNNFKKWHGGVDISGNVGDNVYAFKEGKVLRASWENSSNKNQGFGQRIVIEHRESVDGKEIVTYSVYAHLSEIDVKVGDKIKEGAIIGKIGHTGNASADAVHLHFEIRKDSYPGNSRKNADPSSQFTMWDKIGTFFSGIFGGPMTIPETDVEKKK